MNAIDRAHAFCRGIAHRCGGNFSVGFRFLPRHKRRAVYAAYAFCRWADDVVDETPATPSVSEGPDSAGGASLTLGVTERLDECQRELDRCYLGSPSHPITIALADALRVFAIPKAAFVSLIDGCRQDMVKTRYETFDELLRYCALVASSISDISLAIFGYRTQAAVAHGRDLAIALQLTNVTRDIGDDLVRDRVYLPREELQRFGVAEDELFKRRESESMRRLIEFQIDRAVSYFRLAEPLLDELSFDARLPTLLMGGIYATILARLRRDPLVVLRKRISLSAAAKIGVVTRRLVRPHFV